MVDQLNIKHKKTPRERFSNVDNLEFMKICGERAKNAKRLITRDKNILEGKGTLKGNTIKVTNPKFYENRIKSNEKILNIWNDAYNEQNFDNKVEKGLNEALSSKLENTGIEEVLVTSEYILEFRGGDSLGWDYVNKHGDKEEAVEYFINVYETEEDYENGNDYSGGGLIISEGEIFGDHNETVKRKMDYIKSFIYINN